ncbi:Fructose-bisphosphate aldolase [Geobacillus sp. BCO2]|nr:Fructose-bisphosphate aldolase [Geobacillus sp. BCO2]
MSGFKTVVNMVKGLMEDMNITVPVAIHLDHGSSFEKCKAAIDAGFTSVMIDASHHPFEENVRITSQVVEYAHARGVSVEAELGIVGGQEDDVVGEGIIYADPKECEELVKRTGIDCLAPALGSVHGPYKGEPKLGFAEMEQIRDLTGVPLVLHGGTGIPTEQIQRAISLGTSKIKRQYRKPNGVYQSRPRTARERPETSMIRAKSSARAAMPSKRRSSAKCASLARPEKQRDESASRAAFGRRAAAFACATNNKEGSA